jgi:hypothetical protein
MSLLSSTNKSEHGSKKMTIVNGEQKHIFQRLDESEMTPVMLAEYRRLQHELQCQEALLVLMQKLKTNQKLISQTNTNNGLKQKTTTTTTTPPTTATKLSQQSPLTDVKTPLTATKQSLVNEQLFFSKKKNRFSFSRIIQIDRYQQKHRIQINILLIVQIIILNYLNNNHRKILCHQHLRLLVSQIIITIAHYHQRLHEYHQQYL